MNKAFAFFLSMFCFSYFFPMDSLADSKKGNQVTFQKVLKITDKDESYYFKYPTKIYRDAKENLYILDISRILKFTKEGKFAGNLVTKGRGPGEVTNISNFLLIDQGEKIILHNYHPNRIILKDSSGKLLKEFPIEKEFMMDFIHYYNDTYYFFRHGEFSEIKKGTGIKDVDHYLCTVTPDGKTIKNIHSFPIKKYVVVNGSQMGTLSGIGIGELYYAIYDERYLFVSHTPEYNIKCFDLLKEELINEFQVNYQRKKMPEALIERLKKKGGRLILGGKRFRAPLPEYFHDIKKLLIHGSHLWVVTSTFDEKKGNRIDVFNFKGKNIDSFFTFLPGKNERHTFDCWIYGQHLYSIDTNEEGDVSIIKYKIIQKDDGVR